MQAGREISSSCLVLLSNVCMIFSPSFLDVFFFNLFLVLFYKSRYFMFSVKSAFLAYIIGGKLEALKLQFHESFIFFLQSGADSFLRQIKNKWLKYSRQ